MKREWLPAWRSCTSQCEDLSVILHLYKAGAYATFFFSFFLFLVGFFFAAMVVLSVVCFVGVVFYFFFFLNPQL